MEALDATHASVTGAPHSLEMRRLVTLDRSAARISSNSLGTLPSAVCIVMPETTVSIWLSSRTLTMAGTEE